MDINVNKWVVNLNNNFVFNIPLNYAVTVIYGEGSTGKSFIFQQLQELKSQFKINRSLLLINRTNAMDCSWITQLNNTLTVIDDYEVVKERYSKIVDILNTQRYQCLIFARDINNLKLNRDYIFRLETDEKKREINAVSVFS